MSLNHRELADVLTELSPLLLGARLRKLNSPEPRSCQLVFRTGGADRILLIDLSPGGTRLHLLSAKLPAPPSPPAWVMKCRQEIEGTGLEALECAEGERIVTLRFTRGSKRPGRALVAELFGRRGRLLLLDQEGQLLMPLVGRGTAPADTRPAPAAKSRFPDPDPQRLTANLAVESHYRVSSMELLDQKRQQLARMIEKEKKKLARLMKKLELDLSKTDEAERLSRQGEALKANLGRIKKGQKSTTLADPFDPDGEPIEVELDPALSPVDNMKRIFQRARRLAKAQPKVQSRMDETRRAFERLEELADLIERAGNDEELCQLEKDLAMAGIRTPRKTPSRRKQHRVPYRSYRSESDKTILVGKSGKDNHELTFRVAKGSDLWFHARNTPGAHVIVRLDRNEQIDEQTLLDAATLAAAGSRAKSGDKVEVTYSHVKNVHPLKGAKPGLVSVARGRTILVRLEPDRLKRLHNSLEE